MFSAKDRQENYNYWGNELLGYNYQDFGLVLGGGIKIPTRNRILLLDLRYNYGIIDITQSDDIIKNGNFSLTSVYLFNSYKKRKKKR